MQNLDITRSVSTEELERRWKAVREKMQEKEIDFLIAQNSERFLGGVIRWFTDFGARHQMQFTVIFPQEGDMSTIVCGSEPPHDNFPPRDVSRGIDKHLGHVYFPTINYTSAYDAELAAGVLKVKKNPTIGFVQPAFIPMSFADYLRANLPGATFVDATELVDEIIAIKTEEEIGYIKESAALEDGAIRTLQKMIRPGMRNADVYAELHCYLAHNGCEAGLLEIGSGPMESPVTFNTPRFQNRMIEFGDVVNVLIEIMGPCGYYTELLRPILVGVEPSKEAQKMFNAAATVQQMIVDQMIPGAYAKDLWETYAQFSSDCGFARPHRSFAHAQGLSYMERPNIRPDETWQIKSGMNITVHPHIEGAVCGSMLADNYIVRDSGAERIHRTPKEILIADC